MGKQHVNYLLVGGGAAAGCAAEAIRKLDKNGSMLLIGQEINRPYHRPLLSRGYLSRQTHRAQLIVEPVGWFNKHDVQLITGRRVANLDIVRHVASVETGDEIAYDKLLIATGASPRSLTIPGREMPNVHSLRTIEDTEELWHAIDKARSDGRTHAHGRGRATVVGGGLLGVEVASSLTQLGIGVDLVVSQSHPWYSFAGETTGRLLVRVLEQRGVTVHLSARPEKFEGDGRAQRVVLAAGQSKVDPIPCDFVVVAVGIVPNRDILRGTPIAAEKAILVDDHCRTSVPNVFAAGDVAAVFDARFGKHRINPHWEHARVTGLIAGTNMAGGDEAYQTVSFHSTQAFDLSVRSWGEPRAIDHRLVRGVPTPERPNVIEIGVGADGRVAHALAMGETEQDAALHQLVDRRINVAGLEELLKDPTRPLSGVID